MLLSLIRLRSSCQHANPATHKFPGVTHDWRSDVFHITEQDIIDISPIHKLLYGAPCEDFSLLRLLLNKTSSESYKAVGIDPRPGLHGPTGQVFKQCLLITAWVIKHNPNCEVFVEQVNFSDLTAQ